MSDAFDRRMAEAAAGWYVQLQSRDVSEQDLIACETWRADDPRHEQAWQRVLELVGALRNMPTTLSRPALGRESRLDRRAAVKMLALLAVAAPLGHVGLRSQGYGAELRTATGEQRQLRLDDGSGLQLNTATAVDIDFDRERRWLRLHKGEIRLQVIADPVPLARPFVIAAGNSEIRTASADLLLRCDGNQLRVAVEKGSCVVHAAGRSVAVNTATGVRIDADDISAPSPIDRHIGDWTRGVFYADNLRLADFANELGRYRPGLLRCDPAVADLRISGAFQLRDTDSALESLSGVLPVAIVYRSRWWTTIVPRDSASA